MAPPQPNFDPIARPYRWLEYLTLGQTLERCRLHFLPRLTDRTCALVLGDGDGRFLAAMLAENTSLSADAVDTSGAMLELLRARCRRLNPDADARLHTHHANALNFLATTKFRSYDLIVTHFFLDCLTQSQLEELVAAAVPALAPNTLWLLSDFRIPNGPMQLPARVLVRGLYLAFRMVTGLRTKKLPDHAVALTRTGFIRIEQRYLLFGILTTELWSRD